MWMFSKCNIRQRMGDENNKKKYDTQNADKITDESSGREKIKLTIPSHSHFKKKYNLTREKNNKRF